VTSIGDGAFEGCTRLTNITVNAGNPNYSSLAGILFDINQTVLIQCPGDFGGSYTIPTNVTSIGDYAFYCCSSLTNVTIPNSVTSIGDFAFGGCTSLTNVTIPNSVTSIGDFAFYDCSCLTNVTIGTNVTSIGDGAFFGCYSLTSVTIGTNVTSIGIEAFYYCSSLTSVTIPNSVTSIGTSAFDDCTSLTNVTIPNSVTNIEDYAFSECYSLTSVTIGTNVTSIGMNAFDDCTSLTSVTIPNSVTSIRQQAFFECISLTNVIIPNSVTSIGVNAFYYCTNLTSVTIPNSVTSIGDYAFQSCTSLKGVYFQGNAPAADSTVFFGDTNVKIFYLLGTTGWGSTFAVVNTFLANPQVQSQTVPVSSNVTFTVTPVTTNKAVHVNYQWYFINTNIQTTAGAIAQMLSGFVYGSVVTNSGSGYTTLPNVQFVGGGGTGASGTATVSNGYVTAITVMNTGSGYTSLPAIVIDPPNGLLIGQTNATLTLNAITTNNIGNYYVVITNASFGCLTSSVASLTFAYPPTIVQQPQSVNAAQDSNANFNVVAAGTPSPNYQWFMVSAMQSNAKAVPVVINGFVLAATVTNNGAGYLTIPAVHFVGGSGSGASGIAEVSNRMVIAINIISTGSGYTTPPTILIDPPTAISLTGQTNANLLLTSVTNGNAGNYFVVVTNNFGSVTSTLAGLTIFLPPQSFKAINSNNHQLKLQLTGTPNFPYTLQSTTNLTPPISWQPVITNSADINGNWSITVSNLSSTPSSFFRAVGQ
jgi:hypothetical protein